MKIYSACICATMRKTFLSQFWYHYNFRTWRHVQNGFCCVPFVVVFKSFGVGGILALFVFRPEMTFSVWLAVSSRGRRNCGSLAQIMQTIVKNRFQLQKVLSLLCGNFLKRTSLFLNSLKERSRIALHSVTCVTRKWHRKELQVLFSRTATWITSTECRSMLNTNDKAPWAL